MAHPSPPATVLASHLLAQTTSAIGVLESLGIISSQDASLIRSKLPSPAGPFPTLTPPSPRNDVSGPFGRMNMGPPGQQQIGPPALPARRAEVRAKALWDYHGTEADDLVFRAGDMIIIDEEVNEQWYRGRVIPPGQSVPIERSGLFPSNYVEKLSAHSPVQAPGPGPSGQYYGSSPQSSHPPGPMYQPPPQQGYNQYEKQYQQYPGQPQHGQMMLAQPPPVPAPAPIVVQQEEARKGKFGRLGSQLGNAAVSGAGFGFGSAVASEMVHSIF
ncbi:hypothetical protein TREMEDRAFT_68076 [Tremella mesenterica DSM 1558]|uniref:uncharacterized protein n=1 Tax=Tremella mesenterica (strain ATCC 24925 / CBS 8224 / DSM 1558 / NBRC 9311 / NRRL Y-6157 / RJB 2259-6 / UBC 559-6) TaxID=578456 RepID=UPI0003F4A4E2|nr:uncharacterized protein TREMEDRAFT_68076 [Tremella mesenterica DSM 1558]EIW70468.1 hypothetical protein TREMEDRAFT_68076 [Tremella mesenterica DSM 1558]